MTARPSEAARAAARALDGDLVLAAGAGTGKTHTLVDVFVHLVAGTSARGTRVSPARILALTFGEKAAAELRGRVRARFEALAEAPDADATLAAACVARALELPGAAEWRAAADAVAAAPVATFHSFAAAVLRRHAAEAGLDPAFELLDEPEATALRRRAAEAAVLAALDAPDVQALVRELEFSKGDDARGRGLVEHLSDVAVRLDEEGASAASLYPQLDDADDAVAAHAAGVIAWAQAFDALVNILAGDGRKTTKGAEKGLYWRAQARSVHALLTALSPALDPTLDPLLGEVVEDLTSRAYGGGEAKAGRDALKSANDALEEAHASFRAASLAVAFVRLLVTTEASYAAEKQRLAALDFADLLRRARDLLRESPAVRAETQARFDAVLVDEFQDTNPLQKQLLDLCRGPGVPRLVVGDPKQSIYEFRGADVTVFGDVARETAGAGGQVLALTESRRGRAPLVSFVNRLFARALRAGQHAFEIQFDPERDALAAVRRCDVETIGPAVIVLDSEPREAEPAAVAGLVRRMIERGTPVWRRAADGPDRAERARWRDVAILLRRFTHLDDYLRELRKAGIPHYVVGGRGFYEQQEVRDLCHALTLLDEPRDALSLLGVLRSPLVGLSDPTLLALAEAAPVRERGERGRRRGRLTLDLLLAADFVVPADIPADEATRLGEWLALYRRLRKHADRLGVSGLLRAIVGASDLAALLAATPYGEQRIANLEQLLAQAAVHDAEGLPRTAFVRALAAQVERERSLTAPAQVLGEDDDVVRVMTVHQAKGLEFPIVFVPECGAADRDNFPQVVHDRTLGLGLRVRLADGTLVSSKRAREALDLRKARGRAESLRLFYVACTRARDHLVLSYAPARGRDTWRQAIEEWLEADPEAPSLARVETGAPEPAAPLAESAAEREPIMMAGTALAAGTLTAPAAALADQLVERFGPPRGVAATLVAPVTELSDFDDCPRRYRLRHEVGLAEHRSLPVAGKGAAPALDLEAVLDPGGLDALERGTLAHRLLERVDFADYAARGGVAIAELLGREGHAEPLAPDAREVAQAVRRLLDAPLGRALATRAPGTFAREESFVFAPRPAAGAPARTRLLLKGQIDLVLFDDDAVTVLDYKLSRSTDAHEYRFQLGAYAAAARALFRRPVRAGLVHLRDRVPGPRVHEFADAELDAIEARLAAIAAELAEARRLGRFAGRELPVCTALGCGYRSRCHAPAPTARPTPTPAPAPAPASAAKRQLRLGEGIDGW